MSLAPQSKIQKERVLEILDNKIISLTKNPEDVQPADVSDIKSAHGEDEIVKKN